MTLSSIAEMAAILSCTIRNTNIILNKLKKLKWITWESQRGRGKKSKLYFHKPFLHVAKEHLTLLMTEKGVEKGYEFISNTSFPEEITKALIGLFEEQLGFQEKTENNDRLDRLIIAHPAEVCALDPMNVTSANEAHLITEIFDTLVVYDKKTHLIVPHLVYGWDTEDEIRWTFYLRKGVLFHNRKLLTADDIIYTFKQLSKHRNGTLFSSIKKIEKRDLYTVIFYLEEKNHLFLQALSTVYASIISKDEPLNRTTPIGTGPFQVALHTNEKLLLKAFHSYFKERPFLDEVEIIYVKEGFLQLQHDSKKIVEKGSYCFFFNFKKSGPHQDDLFRKAIAHVVDGKELINDLKGARAFPSQSFWPNDQVIEKEGNLEVAKALVDKSKYKGEKLILAVLNYKPFIEDALWFQRRCEKIGVSIVIKKTQIAELFQDKNVQSFHLFYGGVVLDENDDVAVLNLFESKSSLFHHLFDQTTLRRIDEYLTEAKKEKQFSRRLQIYHRLQQALIDKTAIVFTYHCYDEVQFHESMAGNELNSYGWIDLHKLWRTGTEEHNKPTIVIY